MTRLDVAMIAAAFLTLLAGLSVHGGDLDIHDKSIQILTPDQFFEMYCQGQNSNTLVNLLCNSFSKSTSTTTTTTTSTADSSVEETLPSTTSAMFTTKRPTTPSRAPWCRFQNGTTLPLGYTFMHSECALCQCTQSRTIRCANLQCMPTTCIDGSTPAVRAGQCCSQCAYEKPSNSCLISGINFPHGTILRRTSDSVQCWCQFGSVECRKASNSLFSGLDLWGSGTAVYVILIIVFVVIICGTLLCCAGTLFFYYYYKRQQQVAQENYAEYYNNAGWQPMAEDGQAVEGSAEEKQAEAEAEQGEYQDEYPTGNSEQFIPPPYALYNGSYPTEQDPK